MHLDGLPVVYVTMGTVWNRDLDLFGRVDRGAVRRTDRRWSSPSGSRTTRRTSARNPTTSWSAATSRRPSCCRIVEAVVTHGGSGTTLGALAHGLPLLVVPQGADQYANADAVVAAGAGRRLGRDETTVAAIRDSVRSLLARSRLSTGRRARAGRDPGHAHGRAHDREDRSAPGERLHAALRAGCPPANGAPRLEVTEPRPRRHPRVGQARAGPVADGRARIVFAAPSPAAEGQVMT